MEWDTNFHYAFDAVMHCDGFKRCQRAHTIRSFVCLTPIQDHYVLLNNVP